MLLTNYAVRQRTAVLVFLLVTIIAGTFSYITLPREGTPDLTIPYVFVTAVYRGVSPAEMEHLVTIPLEDQFMDLDNIKELRSTSAEGVSRIIIEFTDREDMDSALQKVKDKIDMARPDLPDDLDEPQAQSINFSVDFPILMLAVTGDADLQRLKFIAEDIQGEIEAIHGIRDVELVGKLEREIRVEIDLPRALAYNLSMPEISHRIRQANQTISAGNLELEGYNLQIRLPGEFRQAFELPELLIANRDGRPVYLSDIATVTDTFKDIETISRIDGKPGISMQIKKRSGVNTVHLVDQIDDILATYDFPPGITTETTMDQAYYIRMMITELENNIISGFLLVIAVLLIFMGLRNAILVALAIPFSMLLSFTVMTIMGITLNMIVLFSLVIAVGMLVDNAIVIVENIFRLRTEGMSRTEAARVGAGEVAWPVITSTLTTLAAFSPLLFWPGIIGQFMGFLPRTLIIVLSCSLFVALVVNPAICSLFINTAGRQRMDRENIFNSFTNGYAWLLRAAMENRALVLIFGMVLLALTILLFERFGGDQELFPDVEPSYVSVSVTFPEGIPIEHTDSVLRRIETVSEPYTDVKYNLATVGIIGGRGMGGGAGAHLGAVHIEFLDIADRDRSSFELVDEIRERIGAIPGADVQVQRERAGPPVGAAISIEVAGTEFDRLSDLATEIIQTIRGTPGLVDVVDDFEDARAEIQFLIDRQRASMLGLDADITGNFMRTAILGSEASKLRAGEEQFDITLRLPLDQRNTTDLLEQLFIPTPDGRNVPLASLGTLEYVAGRGAIERKDQRRVITITGDAGGGRTPAAVLEDIKPLIDNISLPSGYSITYGGDEEEMLEAGRFLLGSFGIALGLIAVILVIQFNSVVYPFIIMFSVLMSMTGVLMGLMICRMNFVVIMTGVGIISLAGVVVNNSIVLVACILQHYREGTEFNEAVEKASRQRLRPVLLTAVTTILALLPMAVGFSIDFHTWPPTIMTEAETSAFWAPMAVAVIFGLGVASLLTLIQVPVMCSVAESLSRFGRRWFTPENH